MLELVARHLKTLDNPRLEVLEASDGEQAWRLAQEHLPDLVVLDVMMPGMSGWEVCRKIREEIALAHTGVVMLTGIGENLNQMTSPLYGADAYIDKPFQFEDFDRKVREALDSRADQRELVSRPRTNGVAGAAKPRPVTKAPRAATKAAAASVKKVSKAAPKKAVKVASSKKAAKAKSPAKSNGKAAHAKPAAKKPKANGKVTIAKAAKSARAKANGKPAAAKKPAKSSKVAKSKSKSGGRSSARR